MPENRDSLFAIADPLSDDALAALTVALLHGGSGTPPGPAAGRIRSHAPRYRSPVSWR
ncbi:hypothetical protein AB0N05_24550 [Nocardia sp. NPDC051030]|uniref:hypothetical protein n=1 Tax=Nocardia sp. NPDC051030 TaxID=3155162 RepID=UPI003437DA65